MELLYSYKFWKELQRLFTNSVFTNFCSVSHGFEELWEDVNCRTQLYKFADAFISENNYTKEEVKKGHSLVLFITNSNIEPRQIRLDFCEYMMIRMAHSEKDV